MAEISACTLSQSQPNVHHKGPYCHKISTDVGWLKIFKNHCFSLTKWTSTNAMISPLGGACWFWHTSWWACPQTWPGEAQQCTGGKLQPGTTVSLVLPKQQKQNKWVIKIHNILGCDFFISMEILARVNFLVGTSGVYVVHLCFWNDVSDHPSQPWRTGWGTAWRTESICPWCCRCAWPCFHCTETECHPTHEHKQAKQTMIKMWTF